MYGPMWKVASIPKRIESDRKGIILFFGVQFSFFNLSFFCQKKNIFFVKKVTKHILFFLGRVQQIMSFQISSFQVSKFPSFQVFKEGGKDRARGANERPGN